MAASSTWSRRFRFQQDKRPHYIDGSNGINLLKVMRGEIFPFTAAQKVAILRTQRHYNCFLKEDFLKVSNEEDDFWGALLKKLGIIDPRYNTTIRHILANKVHNSFRNIKKEFENAATMIIHLLISRLADRMVILHGYKKPSICIRPIGFWLSMVTPMHLSSARPRKLRLRSLCAWHSFTSEFARVS